jgi:hypothetical protein
LLLVAVVVQVMLVEVAVLADLEQVPHFLLQLELLTQ